MTYLKVVFIFLLLCVVFPSETSAGDSIVAVSAGKFKKSPLHRIIWGKHYRKLWAQPVKMEVLDISQEGGGLLPLKTGGGNQTTNLRLENKYGKEYVLRPIEKDPSKSFPKFVRNSFLKGWARDQNTAENPYGALVVPHLAQAAGLLYAQPKLVYITEESGLGNFTPLFAGKIALLEMRPSGDHSEDDEFGNSSNVVGSDKFLKKLCSEGNIKHDEQLYLRSRLFDMLISDWGRHKDQWRWAEESESGKLIYKPIPRDRDHAFYLFNDGLVPLVIVTFFQPKFQSFRNHYGNVKGLNKSARDLDQKLLSQMDRSDWLSEAARLRMALNDQKLEEAINHWPQEVYEVVGEYTLDILKQRRDKLEKAALKAYGHLAKQVTVSGTDQEEEIIVNRLDNVRTTVTLLNSKNRDDTLFYRVFDRRETMEVLVTGLGGNDRFLVEGNVGKSIRIVLAGGDGNNEYIDNSKVTGLKRLTFIADESSDKVVSKSDETKILRNAEIYIQRCFKKEKKQKDIALIEEE